MLRSLIGSVVSSFEPQLSPPPPNKTIYLSKKKKVLITPIDKEFSLLNLRAYCNGDLFCSLFSIWLLPLFTSDSNVYETFFLSVISRVSIKHQNQWCVWMLFILLKLKNYC